MKAVILAAGMGERMRPLTLKTPKPLLKVNGKPIIDYALESFPPEITEVIIAVKYLGSKIRRHVGKKNRGMIVRYVLGSDKGTAYSFMAAKKYLKNERFLFVYGDEIPDKTDVANCLKKDLSILTFKSKNPQVNGIAYLSKDGSIRKIVEKPKSSKSNLGVDGVMVLNTDIFKYMPKLSRGEFYLSTMVGLFVRSHKVFPVKAKNFIGDIASPADLIRTGKILLARYNKKN
ncbi:MAG: nucleotidyltransferase family protein [Candidatus Woesebacteria bacterium]|nr:nucleotidyltransferase family protein [Candidatus Woesebacteria bacterium]